MGPGTTFMCGHECATEGYIPLPLTRTYNINKYTHDLWSDLR